ncbi:MAG: ATP synthase subunit I [Nitrospiraceae bacterium]|nr:ATP synthase subunit I [Nitrospiraceae bacterium]
MEQGSWELMVKRIYKQSAVMLIASAVISIFFTEWRFSLSILIGGIVGIGNLRGIVWSVTALLGAGQARAKMMVLSTFRLLVIFSVLIILAIFGVIKAYGLLAGFTIVFIIMIKESLIAAKKGA